MRWFSSFCAALLTAGFLGLGMERVPVQDCEVLARAPHDRRAFTQGLAFADGRLYESTGILGRSTVRRVDARRGTIQLSVKLGKRHFGEGLTVVGDRIIQATWKARKALVYRRSDLTLLETRKLPGEAWGLTWNGKHLVLSDGSEKLRFLDSKTMAVVRTLTVREGLTPVRRLNELEWVDGEILANVWKSSRIARIDPASGRLRAWLELQPLVKEVRIRRAQKDRFVLNGIAWDPETKRLFVTGKCWPTLFVLRLPALDG